MNPLINPTPEAIATLIAAIVGLFSPIAIEAFKKEDWKPQTTIFWGLMVSIIIYSVLHFLVGTLTYPVTYEFLAGLFAVFGSQQVGYQTLFKNRNRVIEVSKDIQPDDPALIDVVAQRVFQIMESAVTTPPRAPSDITVPEIVGDDDGDDAPPLEGMGMPVR